MRTELSGPVNEALLQAASSPKAPYIFSGVLGITSTLTFNEMVGAIGVFCSILLAAFSAWSNHKRNKAQIRAADAEIARSRANAFPYEIDDRD